MTTFIVLAAFALLLLMALGALMLLFGLIGDVLALLADDRPGAPPGE